MREREKKRSAMTEGVGSISTVLPRSLVPFTWNIVGTGSKFGLDTSMTGSYADRFGVAILMKLGRLKIDSSSSDSSLATSVVSNADAATVGDATSVASREALLLK